MELNSHLKNARTPLDILIAISITVGLLLRVVLFPVHPNLWEDEIIATTHAVQPFGTLLVNVFRNDIHPPLYFIQLHAWSLISHADVWFVCNSIFWSICALASLFIATRQSTADDRLAAAAVGILAILPTSIADAFSVRMYSMLSAMVIWSFYFTHRAFFEKSSRDGIFVAIISLLIVYTHAIGFLAVLFGATYALIQLVSTRAVFRHYLWWIFVYGGTAVLAAPILATDLLHDANLPPVTSFDTTLSWASVSTIGIAGGAEVLSAGLFLFLIVSVAGCINSQTRAISISFIIAPLLLAVLASLTIKPVFKGNFFSAVESPFVALVLARLICAVPKQFFRGLAFAALSATLLALRLESGSLDIKSTNFPAAAGVIRAQWHNGDMIYVPQLSMFWGIAWYLVGSDWGSPLNIAPKPNPQWTKVYAVLGPGLVKGLGLMPSSQKLVAGKFTLYVGDASQVAGEGATCLWVLAYPRADLPNGSLSDTLGSMRKVSTWHFGFNGALNLALYAR